MKIKFKTFLRISFLMIFCFMAFGVFLMYSGYERRALLFEITRGYAFLYIVLIEFTLVMIKNKRIFDNIWKKMIMYLVSSFAIFFLFVATINLYEISLDAFVLGYDSKEVIAIDRNWQYRSSDKVRVEFEGGSTLILFYQGIQKWRQEKCT